MDISYFYIVIGSLIGILTVLIFIITLFKSLIIVREKQEFIVERFGRYKNTLKSGYNFIFPFIDKISYIISIKEQVIDVPPQNCITKDNIQIRVDGVLYMKVVDSRKAAYGIDDYKFACRNLAQTTMRSEIGKLDLDMTLTDRENINREIVCAIDKASEPWGVKITRHEIIEIVPPKTINEAMELKKKAEQHKKADIETSIGILEAAKNEAEAQKERIIKEASGNAEKIERTAKSEANRITYMAEAEAKSLRSIAKAIKEEGSDAANYRIIEKYFKGLAGLSENANTIILFPTNLANLTVENFSDTLKSIM